MANLVLENAFYKQKENLIQEFIDVVEEYGHHPEWESVEKIIDTWFESKAPVMEAFSSHQNWVADKFMILMDKDYERDINFDGVKDFYYWAMTVGKRTILKQQMYLGCFTKNEIRQMYLMYKNIVEMFEEDYRVEKYQGYTRSDVPELRKYKDKYYKAYMKYEGSDYTKESSAKYEPYENLLRYLVQFAQNKINASQNDNEDSKFLLTEEQAEILNHEANKIDGFKMNACAGQRVLKPYLKLFKFFHIDEINEVVGENHGRDVYSNDSWNVRWAALGDAINPLKYKRYTILSFNPIDYLRMSMGAHGWTSCHTIDKSNIDGRDSGNNYSGMHANGTISYMLDESSAVFYTVDANYDGTDFELHDKECRQMFHLGTPENPFFVAGRLYPQSNDCGSNSLYKQIREFVQKLTSEVWDIPNLWNTKKMCDVGYDDRDEYIYNYGGAHYPDYFKFPEVCRLVRNKTTDNFKKIHIGHEGICITCGCSNDDDGQLSCCEPAGERCCCNCGAEIDSNRDEYYEIDGEIYCEDCVFYCDYHERYEPNGDYYGRLYDGTTFCDDAYENSNIHRCEHCDDYYDEDIQGLRTDDGNHYCCIDCAGDEEYEWVEDGYDEYTQNWNSCQCCGEIHHTPAMIEIDSNFYCEYCMDQRRAETEEESNETNDTNEEVA